MQHVRTCAMRVKNWSYPKRRGFKSRTKKRAARAPKSSFAKRVKRVMLKTCEPKHVDTIFGKIELYHNGGALYSGVGAIHLNKSTNMPAQGTGDEQRVGDMINTKGISFKMMCGQKFDRPNVQWRWWVLGVPKGSIWSYTSWFRAIVGNTMLDDPNTDFVRIIKSGYARPNQASLASGVNEREFTFTKRIFVPYRKVVKFGPANGAVTTNDTTDIWFIQIAYDAYGTLSGDNIAYMQSMQTLHYCDP